MTTIAEAFPDLEALDATALHIKRETILRDANSYIDGTPGSYQNLKDEKLAELFQVNRLLRRKAAAPGGAPGSRKKTPATLDDLA